MKIQAQKGYKFILEWAADYCRAQNSEQFPSHRKSRKAQAPADHSSAEEPWTIPWFPANSRAQGSAFPVKRNCQWHRRGQDMNSFALFHMTAHSSEGTAGLDSSNHGRPYRTTTKPVPTFALWKLGNQSTGKMSWPVHNQTMLVTCVWAESESPEASAVPFFMLWIHIPKVAPLELTLGAQNSCTEDTCCDVGKKGFLKS